MQIKARWIDGGFPFEDSFIANFPNQPKRRNDKSYPICENLRAGFHFQGRLQELLNIRRNINFGAKLFVYVFPYTFRERAIEINVLH